MQDTNAAVVNFTLVFAADYATLYGATTAAQNAFRAAFVAVIQAAAPGATVQIDNVVPGSVRVAARVAFPPAASGLIAGYSCAPGASTPCASLVATLASSPGALFATSSAFANIPVSAAGVSVALLGSSNVVAIVGTPLPSPAATTSPPAAFPPPVSSQQQQGNVPPVFSSSPPLSSSSSSSSLGDVMGAGIISPSIILSVLAFFFEA